MSNKRALLIAYQFPPVGGAGVQRVSKLAKFLPRNGWDVSVLTAANHSVPTRDSSLCHDIPAETAVHAARSWEPNYRWKSSVASDKSSLSPLSYLKSFAKKAAINLLQPDPQILWLPNAVLSGLRILRRKPHDAILVSAPPFSSFLVGAILKSLTGVPLVLDYRDEWSLADKYWENKVCNAWTRTFQGTAQQFVLRSADSVVATTHCSARSLARQAEVAGFTAPTTCVFNGFDPQDFAEPPPKAQDRFTLTYVGTLLNLTSCQGLVDALCDLASTSPALLEKVDIEIIGRCTDEQEALVRRLDELPCRLTRQDYVEHSDAIRAMQRSDELLLLLSDLPGAERVMPGKTFEYLASGNRVLAIAPHGEMTRLVDQFDGTKCFSPADRKAIAQHIRCSIQERFREGPRSFARRLASFERNALAKVMAQVLDAATAASRPELSNKTPVLEAR